MEAVLELYDRIVDANLFVRRMSVCANRVVREKEVPKEQAYEQLDLFTDYAAKEQEQKEKEAKREREKHMQQALLSIKNKYGKNAILRGTDFLDGATARERNNQIGGHKA